MAVMPKAEFDVTPTLVRSLLHEQHPDLADLQLELLGNGWDNVLYRLGPALLVRLPRRAVADALMIEEQRWLPGLVCTLGLPTSAALRVGVPGAGYPWHWSVCRWIDGVPATAVPRADRTPAAVPLARFLADFHRPAPDDAPVSPVGRGGPLAARDDVVRARLASLGQGPGSALQDVWAHAIAAPTWSAPPVWLHGDLHPANTVLSPTGELAHVVDFGDLCAGDPATDLAAAWLHFDPTGRAAFRGHIEDLVPVEPGLWDRARGWAVSLGSALAASSDDAPALHALGIETLHAVLED